MKSISKILYSLLLITTFLSCEDNTQNINQNNLVPQTRVDFTFNSPELSNPLGFKITENRGIKGIVAYRSANGTLKAFDLACPFLSQSDCSSAMNTSNLPASLNCSNCSQNPVAFFLENPVQKIGDINFELQQYRIQKIDQFEYRVTNF